MHAWEQIQKTIDYLEEHLDQELDIKGLAEMAALSPFYYQRLFSRLVKKPVAEYIRLRRMAKAAGLLLQKDQRILDAALKLGFSSHEHFTRTFKAAFGMTPDEYRRHPKALNRMTKPELSLQYTLVDEGVPLVAGGVVIEISRSRLNEPVYFIGVEKTMPASFVAGLGTESGADPLDSLWREFHERKKAVPGMPEDGEELGVAYPCGKEGYFCYFAGAQAGKEVIAQDYTAWELPKGEYIVCSFEAESFEDLVLDALYKAQQYVFGVWLPKHKLQTEPFCAERYKSHGPQTTYMELWLRLKA